jgi:secreted protein with Ig-like and vWFA domain
MGAETYALLMVTAPAENARSAERREVQFIIDTSGSMYGPSIAQARVALQMGVDRLSAGDRFNIIRFSSDASSLFPTPQPVSQSSRTQASRFIDSLQASGGTEMRASAMRPKSSISFAGGSGQGDYSLLGLAARPIPILCRKRRRLDAAAIR